MDSKDKGENVKNIGQDIDMQTCLVGGNWNNGSIAGAFTLNLNNSRANSNNNVGGRDCIANPEISSDNTGNRGICCPAISEINQSAFLSSNAENQSTSKRVGNLYDKTFTLENLHEAYLIARKGKRKKPHTYAFEINLGQNLADLYDELKDGIYKPQPYRQFEVYEPKKRVINAPHFRDLVVQHAIYKEIYEVFDKSFIDHAYACRKGKGTHKASEYTQKEMRKYSGELYSLKLDIKKYFYSIDRGILRGLFEKKIKDKRFVDLMCEFTKMGGDIGIPIGNLLSQIYASIYMNETDHFVKRALKVKSYVRYVDDFILIGLTLDEAKSHKETLEKFVKNRLNLELSHWTIAKIKRGINFVGYRTWKSKKFVRKHSMYKFKKAVKTKNIKSIASLFGHAKGTDTMPYYQNIIKKEELCIAI